MKFVIASACLMCVALAGWVQPASKLVASEMLGLSFPAPLTGYVAGSLSDGTKFVKKTTDGGKTFTTTKANQKDTLIIFDIHCASVENCVLAGLGVADSDNQYTLDGENWLGSDDFEVQEAVQSVQAFGTPGKPVAGHFGLTGNFGATNGVGVSTDGGKSFSFKSWDNTRTGSRYGSFPTADTWFVAGGNWPERNTDANKHYISRSIYRDTKTGGIKYHGAHNPKAAFDVNAASDQNYTAAIQMTTDGGTTFKNVFFHTNDFYFNQIACPSTTTCFAVAEGFGENGGPVGGWIWATKNAGTSWEQQLFQPGASFMTVRCVSETACFAGGIIKNSQGAQGALFNTTDGKSWNLAPDLPEVYFLNIAAVSETELYATVTTPYDTMEFLAYQK